jgi:hypothetical protein
MCDDFVDLLPLADSGELSDEEMSGLSEHLRSCAACRVKAAKVAQVPLIIGSPPDDGWSADVANTVRSSLSARSPRVAVKSGHTPVTLERGRASGGRIDAPTRSLTGGRARRIAGGLIGVALIIALFAAYSLLLQTRQQVLGIPVAPPTVQVQNSPYTVQNAAGTFHIAVVAGNNPIAYKQPQFLFFYAMKAAYRGTPTVTAILQFSPDSTPLPIAPTPVVTAVPGVRPVIVSPTSTAIITTTTLRVTDIQPLGQIAEFDVGVIHTEWADPTGRTLILTVRPPGGGNTVWEFTPYIDIAHDIRSPSSGFFKSSPPEIGQVEMACPCGQQAFRLAIFGRPVRDAQPLIMGIDPNGAVALMSEAEYFKEFSPDGTPGPTEDTESTYLVPTYPPTITPLKPLIPPAVATSQGNPATVMALAGTIIPAPTEVPGLQETMVARATVSPFPTAGPSSGRSGSPAIVADTRGGLSIELRLIGDNYVVGENTLAQVTLQNASTETLVVRASSVELLDEQGQQPDSWTALAPWAQPWPGHKTPLFERAISPGQSVSTTITLQMPTIEQSAGHSYTASASVRFSRAKPDSDVSDGVWIELAGGSIPLHLTAPSSVRHLVVVTGANGEGYTVRVTDEQGHPLSGGAWGLLAAQAGNCTETGPLLNSPDGTWTNPWDDCLPHPTSGGPVTIQGWVAARGYMASPFTQTIVGDFGIGTPVPTPATR